MKNQSKKLVAKFLIGVVFSFLFLTNIVFLSQENENNIDIISLSSAQANNEDGSSNNNDNNDDCCKWYNWGCNKRVESITVTCSNTTTIKVTYLSNTGHAVGTGYIRGGTMSVTSGYATSNYITQSSTTEAFQATKVNCPTDGKCPNCTPYDPC